MGGAVSTGQNNNDLVDKLVAADYIRKGSVEKVFRAVDRADYFLPNFRKEAYKDLAWKNGNLHLSAPCIYSEVMEGLELEPGLSFLNLGSGSGYLSTMAGLILGSNGINHGVEIHQDIIQYAIKKLEYFKKSTGYIDQYDFCEPKFFHGNCLSLASDTLPYDRIYCGAACPEQHVNYLKNLLRTHGILVMPYNEQLLQIKRLDEENWDIQTLLPVSFASLITSFEKKQEFFKIDIEPATLQAICRSLVRNILRKNIEMENPNIIFTPAAEKKARVKQNVKRFVLPIVDSDGDTTDEERDEVQRNKQSNNKDEKGNDDATKKMYNFIDLALENKNQKSDSQQSSEQELKGRNKKRMHDDLTETEGMDAVKFIEQPSTEEDRENNDKFFKSKPKRKGLANIIVTCRRAATNDTPAAISKQVIPVEAILEQPVEEECGNDNILHSPFVNEELMDGIQEAVEGILSRIRSEESQNNAEGNGPSPDETKCDTIGEHEKQKINELNSKLDCELADEIMEKYSIYSSADSDEEVMEIDDSSSSSDEDDNEGFNLGELNLNPENVITLDSSSDSDDDDIVIRNRAKVVVDTAEAPPINVYSVLMKKRILDLPLPSVIKNYLNFYREF